MEELRRNQSHGREESQSRCENIHGQSSRFMVVRICFVDPPNALNTTLIGTIVRRKPWGLQNGLKCRGRHAKACLGASNGPHGTSVGKGTTLVNVGKVTQVWERSM